MYSNAIFDLDGTLIDTSSGILKSLRYAFNKLHYPVPDEKTLFAFIGPSLVYSFTALAGLDAFTAQKAVEAYREAYLSGGMFDCRFYDGIVDLLKKLRAKGIMLSIASSKPKQSVERLLAHFGIADFFAKISAPDFKVVSNDKTHTVAAALTGGRAVMVGDRKFDILGAQANGIDSIGVQYGFAPDGEFAQFKPTYLAKSASEIEKIILNF